MPKMLEFLDFKLFRGSTPYALRPARTPFPPFPQPPPHVVRYFQVAFLFSISAILLGWLL